MTKSNGGDHINLNENKTETFVELKSEVDLKRMEQG